MKRIKYKGMAVDLLETLRKAREMSAGLFNAVDDTPGSWTGEVAGDTK